MNITLIQFSPSGNTLKVAKSIQSMLEQDGTATVQRVDITRDPGFFGEGRAAGFLEDRVARHDVLMIGGPVYAHHLQYHVQDLIRMLPEPDGKKWGKVAIPFVTYGGIASGIALEEAGKLLRKSGRTVVGGLKVVASHKMTRAFLDQEFNAGKPGEELVEVLRDLKQRLAGLAAGEVLPHGTGLLRYQSRLKALAIRLIFDEKKWHRERYPRIHLDKDRCTGCGACAELCPVLHLQQDSGGTIRERPEQECIHCLNCVTACPAKGIGLRGDLEKGREFMNGMIRKHGNREIPGTSLY